MPNDQVQQRGRLERSHATKSRSAGPGRCNGWFGDVIPLESNPDPFVFPFVFPNLFFRPDRSYTEVSQID
jgi:hypothetical protein